MNITIMKSSAVRSKPLQEEIGTVKEILSPGANDVWVVKGENGKEYHIPYIEDVVKSSGR